MNILDLRLNNEELNEVLKDDFFIEAFELASKSILLAVDPVMFMWIG